MKLFIVWLGTAMHKNWTHNWMAPWKNRICSTTRYLKKITRKASDATENLQLYRVVRFFRPRSFCTTHLMFTSADICVVHDDLGWRNRTTRYNRFWRAGYSWL